MKKALLFAMIAMMTAVLLPTASSSLAQSLPQEIADWLQTFSTHAQDFLLFDLPDGSRQAYVLDGWGLFGFAEQDGAWQNISGGLTMGYPYQDARLVRHEAQTLRADGTPYGDALGFDLEDSSGTRVSYRYDGSEFVIAGWYDPFRYAGEVMVRGTALAYYNPAGSAAPEAVVDAGDMQTLRFWISDFDQHPATPDEAKALSGILKSGVAQAFIGYELCSYEAYDWGTQASACYARIEGNLLHIKRTEWKENHVLLSETNCMPIPLSPSLLKRLETEPLTAFIDASGMGDAFLTEDAFDTALVPVTDKVIQSDLQAQELVLLTEDASGSRCIQIVRRDEGGRYTIDAKTPPLPEGSRLDLFHAGDGDILLDWSSDGEYLNYTRRADGKWQLSYSSAGYSLRYCGVLPDEGAWHSGNQNALLIGTLPGTMLEDADPLSLPQDRKSLSHALERTGWAVVDNPNPSDRLHLRAKPDRSAESLGKFYNGTPVQVLSRKGDWSEVMIGLEGLRGWMMTRYLTFGSDMDDVRRVFPDLVYRDEHYESRPAYADKSCTDEVVMSTRNYFVIGVVEDKLYILLTEFGQTGYVPQDWLFGGNG